MFYETKSGKGKNHSDLCLPSAQGEEESIKNERSRRGFMLRGGINFQFSIFLLLATFGESLVIGLEGFWGKWAWLAARVYGLGLMALEFFTFGASNYQAFGNLNTPELFLFLFGAAVSAAGFALGKLIALVKAKKKTNKMNDPAVDSCSAAGSIFNFQFSTFKFQFFSRSRPRSDTSRSRGPHRCKTRRWPRL